MDSGSRVQATLEEITMKYAEITRIAQKEVKRKSDEKKTRPTVNELHKLDM